MRSVVEAVVAETVVNRPREVLAHLLPLYCRWLPEASVVNEISERSGSDEAPMLDGPLRPMTRMRSSRNAVSDWSSAAWVMYEYEGFEYVICGEVVTGAGAVVVAITIIGAGIVTGDGTMTGIGEKMSAR